MAIAAIYARKSTDDRNRNAEARSTRRQIESATAYAERRGWTVERRGPEGEVGRSQNEPATTARLSARASGQCPVRRGMR